MNFLGIIPARYQSSRFPGKPLVDIKGKSMVQRVYEQVLKSEKITRVIVATDDERIAEHVRQFNGNVMMTSSEHKSGTDRCAEVLDKTKENYDVIVNIQGDEPFINPLQIDAVCNCFLQNKNISIATLIKKITSVTELENENVVKAIINNNKEAIYFSRTPLPFIRGTAFKDWLNKQLYYKHIGIYGYTAEVLKQITGLVPSALEIAESLEQLRWIENGIKIKTVVTDTESVAIDTPEDLSKIGNLS